MFFVFFLVLDCNALDIVQKQLTNGLRILVIPTNTTQKVSCQLFYNVGSKHEQSAEKGRAHLLEHMCFKGTELMSESDIPLITHKLSAYGNAATTYDWTKYYFEVPIRHWRKVLPILADCMQNCTFKDDLLNAEYKAVFQEFNMRKDYYQSQLVERLIGAIFYDHPYHYPIIGYKYDLWETNGAKLHSFYKKYYGPNNAVLVIAGNVDPQEVFEFAEQCFGNIPSTNSLLPTIPPHYEDLAAKNVTLYRDVETAHCLLAFTIPGLKGRNFYTLNLLSTMLTEGKTSLLQDALMQYEQLVHHVNAGILGLFDHDLFVISFQPYEISKIGLITEKINTIIQEIGQGNIPVDLVMRANKMVRADLVELMENNSSLASTVGRLYLATGNEKTLFEYCQNYDELIQKIAQFTRSHLRPIQMHSAVLLPLPEHEKNSWHALQEEQTNLDAAILKERERKSDIEPAMYADVVSIDANIQSADYAKPTVHHFNNGLTGLVYCNPDTPTFCIKIQLKADGQYDSTSLPALYKMVSYMMSECGTVNYSAADINELLESHALKLRFGLGIIKLSGMIEDLPIGLDILTEILTNIRFDQQTLQKVRQQVLAEYRLAQDSPGFHADRIVMEHLYKNHPFSKNSMGTQESINTITLEDIEQFFHANISPDGAAFACVGDFSHVELESLIAQSLCKWRGGTIDALKYGVLAKPDAQIINHTMDRDQVVLIFAGQSVDRLHPDYNKLIIFDQIFGQGMHSVLFQLREKTGLFYKISGASTYYSSDQPGIWIISCLVTPNSLEQAKKLICDAIMQAVDAVTDEAVEQAKRQIINAADDLYSTNRSIASAFLYLHKYNLPWDYAEKQQELLASVTADSIKQVVKKVLDLKHAIIVQVGKV